MHRKINDSIDYNSYHGVRILDFHYQIAQVQYSMNIDHCFRTGEGVK